MANDNSILETENEFLMVIKYLSDKQPPDPFVDIMATNVALQGTFFVPGNKLQINTEC